MHIEAKRLRVFGLQIPFRRETPNDKKIDNHEEISATVHEEVPTVLKTDGTTPSKESRNKLIEKWKKARRIIRSYPGGKHPDGTEYKPGIHLTIDHQQVMDTFEELWCIATTDVMFKDKNGPLVVVERGFGLGRMSRRILREMLSRGGEYHIIELNEQVAKDASHWANNMQKHIDSIQLHPPLKIFVHNGDADEVIQEKFGPESVDLIFSDTHQLRSDERGINDLLGLEELKKRLKEDGRFTFCAFHRDNQGGGLDIRQIALLKKHFDDYHIVRSVEVIPSADCEYMEGPRARLPVVICQKPI